MWTNLILLVILTCVGTALAMGLTPICEAGYYGISGLRPFVSGDIQNEENEIVVIWSFINTHMNIMTIFVVLTN
jgi:hypothetical protein